MDPPQELPQQTPLTMQTDEDVLSTIERDPEGGIAKAIERFGSRLRGRLRKYALDRRYGDTDVDDIWLKAFVRLLDPECRVELRAAGGQILPWLSRWGYWRLDDAAARKGALPENLKVPDPTAPDEAAPSELIVTLRRVFPFLSPRQRLILRMRYEERLSEKQVAERLEISPAAAKKAAHDARERLRHLINEAGMNQDHVKEEQ